MNAERSVHADNSVWKKSSYSGSSGGDCVEVAACRHAVHVRDSKTPDGPALSLLPHQWAQFVTYAAGRVTR